MHSIYFCFLITVTSSQALPQKPLIMTTTAPSSPKMPQQGI